MQPGNDSSFGVIMTTGAMIAGQGEFLLWNASTLETFFFGNSKSWSLKYVDNTNQGLRHVVMTWNQCHGAKLYMNGQLVSTKTTPGPAYVPVTGAPRFVLGASAEYKEDFDGDLDELRVWDTVMSDKEVLALFDADSEVT